MVFSHLQVVKQRLLVNVLPEDLGDCIEEAVKDRHQKKLILLTASQLSNKTVMLGGVINHWYACHTPEMFYTEDIETESSKTQLCDSEVGKITFPNIRTLTSQIRTHNH